MRTKTKGYDEMDAKPTFMKPAAFAREIDASASAVYRMIARRLIPAVYIGKTIRIPSSAIEQLREKAMKHTADGLVISSESQSE
jgi:excisionase family DNA binding protein